MREQGMNILTRIFLVFIAFSLFGTAYARPAEEPSEDEIKVARYCYNQFHNYVRWEEELLVKAADHFCSNHKTTDIAKLTSIINKKRGGLITNIENKLRNQDSSCDADLDWQTYDYSAIERDVEMRVYELIEMCDALNIRPE